MTVRDNLSLKGICRSSNEFISHIKDFISKKVKIMGGDLVMTILMEDLIDKFTYAVNHLEIEAEDSSYYLVWVGYLEVLFFGGNKEEFINTLKFMKNNKITKNLKYLHSWARYEYKQHNRDKSTSILHGIIDRYKHTDSSFINETKEILFIVENDIEISNERIISDSWLMNYITNMISFNKIEREVSSDCMKKISKLGPPSRVSAPMENTNIVESMESQKGDEISGSPLVASSLPFEAVTISNKRYFIIGVIGRGATSKVFKVLSEDGVVYALKEIEIPDVLDNKKGLLFNPAKERDIIKGMQGHAHIVQMENDEIKEKKASIIMEFGEIDLDKLMKYYRNKEAFVRIGFIRYYWYQMLTSIKTLHENNIIHCDIKPNNFIVVGGVLKCIDFGISKWVLSDNDTIVVPQDSQVGTINYMSPEALRGHRFGDEIDCLFVKIGLSSDIWSLGCILYEMIYGKSPFSGIIPTRKRAQSILEHYPDYPYCDEVYRFALSILKKILVKDPDKRPKIQEIIGYEI